MTEFLDFLKMFNENHPEYDGCAAVTFMDDESGFITDHNYNKIFEFNSFQEYVDFCLGVAGDVV